MKLPYVNSWINKRRKIAKIYSKILKNTSLKLPSENKSCRHVFHLYVVFHPKRDFIIRELKKRNIHININYPFPIHKMKGYKNNISKKSPHLPMTENMAKGIFSLPLYPTIKIADVLKISKSIKKILLKI